MAEEEIKALLRLFCGKQYEEIFGYLQAFGSWQFVNLIAIQLASCSIVNSSKFACAVFLCQLR